MHAKKLETRDEVGLARDWFCRDGKTSGGEAVDGTKKNLRRLTYGKKPNESGGTKKNLEARLPTAPLGIEIANLKT